MAKKGRGSPFLMLINARIFAVENAIQRGDIETAVSNMLGLGELLTIKISSPPFSSANLTPIPGGELYRKQLLWINRERVRIDAGVADWMRRNKQSGLGVLLDEDEE